MLFRSGIISTQTVLLPFDTQISITVQLYRYEPNGMYVTVSEVPGAGCMFLDLGSGITTYTFTEIVPAAERANCSATISASFNAGDAGYWGVTASALTPAGVAVFGNGSTPAIPLNIAMSLGQ